MDRSTLKMPDVASAAGLAKPQRSRWTLVLGVGVVVVIAGWATMHSAVIRERLIQAKAWINEQVGATPSEDVDPGSVEPTKASTSLVDQPAQTDILSEPGPDYPDGQHPDGLGQSTETLATNGRSAAASRR